MLLPFADSSEHLLEHKAIEHVFFCVCRRKLSEFIDKADYGGLTALHLAAYIQHADCTRLLLDLHADTSRKSFEAGTVLPFVLLLRDP